MFTRKVVRQVGRKTARKTNRNLQNNSLKLFPSTLKLWINQSDTPFRQVTQDPRCKELKTASLKDIVRRKTGRTGRRRRWNHSWRAYIKKNRSLGSYMFGSPSFALPFYYTTLVSWTWTARASRMISHFLWGGDNRHLLLITYFPPDLCPGVWLSFWPGLWGGNKQIQCAVLLGGKKNV